MNRNLGKDLYRQSFVGGWLANRTANTSSDRNSLILPAPF